MNNKLFTYIISLLVLLSITYAQSSTYNVSYYQLPKFITTNISLNYPINTTANITSTNYITTRNNITFINTTYTLPVNISLPLLQLGNYSSELIIKTTTNSTFIHFFNFNIINTSSIPIDYTVLGINEFEYPLCTYNLPQELTRDITINAPVGTLINLTYNHDIFEVKNNFIMPSNSTTTKINISVPEKPVGKYTEKIIFKSLNNEELIFHFDLKKCEVSLDVCGELRRQKSTLCELQNMTHAQFIECESKDLEYRSCLLNVLNDTQINNTNNTRIEYVINNTYVEAIALRDPILRDAIHTLPETLSTLQENDKQRQSQIQNILTKIDDFLSSIDARDTKIRAEFQGTLNNVINENTELKQEVQTYQEDYISLGTIIAFIITALIITGIATLIILYKNNYFII